MAQKQPLAKTFLTLLAAYILLLVCSSGAPAADGRQFKMEAAYLQNFFHYITWPGYESPEALTTPVICVSRKDPVIPYLKYIQQKAGMDSFRLHLYSTPASFDNCHILFTRSFISDEGLPPYTLKIFSDPSNYLGSGEMIELKRKGNHIAIKINYSLLDKQGFKVSSRLLNLAESVQ